MKKLKKFSKVFFITLSLIFASMILTCVGYYYAITHGVSLDIEKIEETKAANNLKIYDINNNQITPSSEAYIEISKLSADTKNAFISTEDKRFYSHNGIDYIRIGGAIISNLKSKKFTEGASTISQQLIKNVLLSNEKTINRKLKEFKLARELEKEYSKDEILEIYLNNIYFGNGAYGIENAAIYYFGKSAEYLTLAESALLAASINAPSVYDIQNNTEKALERKDLILKSMYKNGKISEEKMNSAQNETPTINITKLNSNNYIYNEIIEEASTLLNLNQNELKNLGIEIHTNYDLNLASSINNAIKNNYPEISNYNIANIVIDNKTNTIVSVYGNKKTLNSNKQPGSVIKPILVYAPAIEENIISPATKILDEKINISGYSPENADKTYHGYVSVREALKNSYNVPAVKILNEVGISKAQNFAKKLNINFSEKDNNLAIALGGFTNGITLKQIADAYSAFSNNGYFAESKYISHITKKDKILCSNSNNKTKAMNESTAYLITNILKDTSKSGTAKRLKEFDFDIASKTGTVGKNNSNKNTDAYCVSYTTNHTIISYIGASNLPETINGASYPTLINKSVFNYIYNSKKPQNFKVPKSIEIKKIDKTDYSNNIVAESILNEEYIEEVFSKSNPPSKSERLPDLKLEVFNFENRKPILSFFASKNYTYNIFRKHKNKEEKISSLKINNDSKIAKFEDISAKSNEIYEYFVEICENSTNKTFKTNKIKLKSF